MGNIVRLAIWYAVTWQLVIRNTSRLCPGHHCWGCLLKLNRGRLIICKSNNLLPITCCFSFWFQFRLGFRLTIAKATETVESVSNVSKGQKIISKLTQQSLLLVVTETVRLELEGNNKHNIVYSTVHLPKPVSFKNLYWSVRLGDDAASFSRRRVTNNYRAVYRSWSSRRHYQRCARQDANGFTRALNSLITSTRLHRLSEYACVFWCAWHPTIPFHSIPPFRSIPSFHSTVPLHQSTPLNLDAPYIQSILYAQCRLPRRIAHS